MSDALANHLQKQQDDVYAVQAVAAAMRVLAARKDEDSHELAVDLAEMAFRLARQINEALDVVNLPKGEVQ